jgi:hypothetical protein
VSLSCSGYRSYVSRFKAAGLNWREFIVPGASLWRVAPGPPARLWFLTSQTTAPDAVC